MNRLGLHVVELREMTPADYLDFPSAYAARAVGAVRSGMTLAEIKSIPGAIELRTLNP